MIRSIMSASVDKSLHFLNCSYIIIQSRMLQILVFCHLHLIIFSKLLSAFLIFFNLTSSTRSPPRSSYSYYIVPSKEIIKMKIYIKLWHNLVLRSRGTLILVCALVFFFFLFGHNSLSVLLL